MNWFEIQESWHEFFLMSGTAAVTLAGLLFVALSIHVDALLDEKRQHLLALAQTTLLSFIFVMTLSLMQLIPHQNMRMTGVQLIVMGVVFFGFTLYRSRLRAVGHAAFTQQHFRRRQLFPLVIYGWTVFVGARLLMGETDAIFMMVGALTALLASAVNTSWDLLVRVARMRRDAATPEPAAVPVAPERPPIEGGTPRS